MVAFNEPPVDPKELEHGGRLDCAAVPSFFGLRLLQMIMFQLLESTVSLYIRTSFPKAPCSFLEYT